MAARARVAGIGEKGLVLWIYSFIYCYWILSC